MGGYMGGYMGVGNPEPGNGRNLAEKRVLVLIAGAANHSWRAFLEEGEPRPWRKVNPQPWERGKAGPGNGGI